MILKILTRKSPGFKSLIDYMLKEGKGENGGKPELMTHNMRGSQQKEWVREFYENEAYRQRQRSNQVYLYHEIISFSNQDTAKISKEMLKDIAEKYISLRGDTGMYIASFHVEGKDHQHIHFCTSGLEYRTGVPLRLSRADLLNVKQELQRYQQERYPELSNSLPKHGRGVGNKSNPEWRAEQRNGTSIKRDIAKRVQSLFEQSKSQNDFYAMLQDEGLYNYERGGKVTGICYGDTKYRFNSLGIDMERLQDLPIEMSETDTAFKEIQSIREEVEAENRELEMRNEESQEAGHNFGQEESEQTIT